MRNRTRDLILCAMFTALTAISAFIRIPLPPIPFTLQITVTTLAGLLLGSKKGALSVGVYVLLGLIGFPIFTQGGGISYIAKPTFGYLLGFIIGAYVTGLIAERKKRPSLKRLIISSLTGTLCVYIIGTVYFYIIYNYLMNTPITITQTLLACVVLVAPLDIILSVIASVVAKKIIPTINK